MALNERVEVEIGEAVRALLIQRGEGMMPTERLVERELGRFYVLLDHGRAEARELLSADELGLIIDASNGTCHSLPHTVFLLHHSIADAVVVDGLDQNWGVDRHALVAKLEGMSPAAVAALVDATERFWAGKTVAEWWQMLD